MLKRLLFFVALFMVSAPVCAQETRTLKHDYLVRGVFTAQIEKRDGVNWLVITDNRAEQYFLRNGRLTILAKKDSHALIRYVSRPDYGYSAQRDYREERGGDLVIPMEALNMILAGERVPTPENDKQDERRRQWHEAAGLAAKEQINKLYEQEIGKEFASIRDMLLRYEKDLKK